VNETILIVEDEISLQETLAYNLNKEGYQVSVVGDGLHALEITRTLKPSLILLDIMLPGLDGFEITRILRQETNIPIIILTARDEVIDRVVGLEIGADDYLTKPFSMRELIARVKVQLRHARLLQAHKEQPESSEEKGNIHIFDNLVIDETRHEVTLNENPVKLKPKEYDLLLFLAEHKGQAFTREKILKNVWGWDYFGDSRTVDVHIRWLRKKLEADPSNPKRLITVRGGGYRFEG